MCGAPLPSVRVERRLLAARLSIEEGKTRTTHQLDDVPQVQLELHDHVASDALDSQVEEDIAISRFEGVADPILDPHDHDGAVRVHQCCGLGERSLGEWDWRVRGIR